MMTGPVEGCGGATRRLIGDPLGRQGRCNFDGCMAVAMDPDRSVVIQPGFQQGQQGRRRRYNDRHMASKQPTKLGIRTNHSDALLSLPPT